MYTRKFNLIFNRQIFFFFEKVFRTSVDILAPFGKNGQQSHTDTLQQILFRHRAKLNENLSARKNKETTTISDNPAEITYRRGLLQCYS